MLALLVVGLTALPACRLFRSTPQHYAVMPKYGDVIPNPLAVPLVDREWIMDQVSDELDIYFRIDREERIRLVDNVLTEGWIETHPQLGGTLLEPWRQDSTPGYERLLATLQTIRRYARVRVIPTADHYLIDVQVFKELEDMPQPDHSTVAGAVVRHDTSLDADYIDMDIPQPNRGWIPMGRDTSLEQKILRNIHSRLAACKDGLLFR